MHTTRLKTWLCLAALGFAAMGCKGNSAALLSSDAEESGIVPRATKTLVAQKPATVILQVTHASGTPASDLNVVFSRMISGKTSEPAGSATTDANGRATLTIVADRTTGYYSVHANNASGHTLGRWHSIPINSNDDNILSLPIGGIATIHPGGPTLTVMTRNIYLGGDINRVLVPSNPDTPIPVLVAQTWSAVQQTNFAERARAIADEIAVSRPHLIGLQEVSLFRIQNPGDFLSGNPVKASVVALDQLVVLL